MAGVAPEVGSAIVLGCGVVELTSLFVLSSVNALVAMFVDFRVASG